MTRLVAADVCRLSPQSKNEIQPRAADCKTPDVPHVRILHNYTHTHTQPKAFQGSEDYFLHRPPLF